MGKSIVRDKAVFLVKLLKNAGYEAVFAGGCVRDELLGITPNDYDIATNATPDQIEEVFKAFKTIAVGKSFGVINVIIGNDTFDVTTFRKDIYERLL